ncbi:MAG: hypothetical protein ACI9ND_001275 [Yoonia sp.]|jgi:hypothetical protein
MMVAGIWTSSKVDQLLRVMIHCDQTKGLFALFLSQGSTLIGWRVMRMAEILDTYGVYLVQASVCSQTPCGHANP